MKKFILISVILLSSYICFAQNNERVSPTEHIFNLTQTNEVEQIKIFAPEFYEAYDWSAWDVSLENNLLNFKRKSDGLTHQWNLDALVFIKINPKNNKVNIEVNLPSKIQN